jgi:hypothetical protein
MTQSSRSPEWQVVRRVSSLKPATYRCPFCGGLLHAMSDHVLVACQAAPKSAPVSGVEKCTTGLALKCVAGQAESRSDGA